MTRKSTCLAFLVLVLGSAWAVYGATVDLGEGLVAWWAFDEAAGTIAYDGSGNNNHATLMGGATWATPGAPGKEGSAISLNGTSAFLRIEHSPSLDLTNAMTYEMWVYYTGTPADALFCKGVAGDGNAWKNLAVRLDDDPVTYRQLNWRSRGGDTVNALNSNTGLPLSEWVHVAVTFDVNTPGDNQKIYINGKLDAENRSNNPLTANAGPLFIGAETYTQPNGRWFFQGMIDEGSLYNRALNPVEIKTIAGVKQATDPTPASGATVSTTALLLEWWQGSNMAYANGHHLYFSDQLADVETRAAGADKGFTTDPNYAVSGLVPGATYYWRVDEVNDVHPDKLWSADVWSFTVASEKAAVPDPADGARYVNRNRVLSWAPGTGTVSHRVYFGVDQTKVAAGAAEVDKGTTTDPNYTPGVLTHDTIYYWRVDEFDGAATHPGDLWSFETTASGDPNLVGWWPFDGDYLDISGNENHGRPINDAGFTIADARPYSGPTDVLNLNGTNQCVYVPYSTTLDIATAGTVAIWVYGGAGNDAPIRHGGWNASYSFRLDNATTRRLQFRTTGAAPGLVTNTGIPSDEWTHIALTFDYTVPEPENNQKFYLNGVVDAENRGATAIASNLYYVAIGGRENANSMWGGMIDDARIYNRALKASEVKVAMTGDPNLATDPSPADKSTPDEEHAQVLTWTAGENAAEHDVYFGADAGAVQNATPADPLGVYRGRQTDASFAPPEPVQWGHTYYWRIDEVKDGHPNSPWKGRVWSFTVADFLAVDDFESYTIDDGSRIYETWIDGYTDGKSGSVVGYLDAPFAERTIVHSGRQSMPFAYDNSVTPFYSQARREWIDPQDWTRNGLDSLVLYVRGNPVAFVETAPGAITMSAAGTDIYGTADQCRFAYKSLTGNGTIVARVDSVGNTDPWAKGGIMIRESLDAGSKFAIVFASPGNGVRFQARLMTDLAATSDTPVATPEQIALQTPVWVKLERIGNAFNGFYSTDGVKWTAMSWNPQTINMIAPTVYIGLAVTSHNASTATTAAFSGIVTTGNVAGAWQQVEIGADHPGNSQDDLYLVVEDTAGKTAVVVNPDAEAVLKAEWTEWKIPLSSLAGVNLARIEALTIGVGDRANPTANGTGLVFIDDIRLVKPAQ